MSDRIIATSLVLAAALGIAATSAAPRFAPGQAPAAAPGPLRLRVMTYNIKHGATNAACTQPPANPGGEPPRDCALDPEAAVEVVREHRPDIVAFQEIDRFWARSAHADQPALLGERLELPHQCYGANLDHPPDSHSARPHQYGTLVLSRYPIRECRTLPLRRAQDGSEPRGLTLAVIEAGKTTLEVYNTHLHTRPEDRRLQGEDIAAALDRAPRRPAVLMGDLNARPDAAELAPLHQRLRDAWQAAGAAAQGNPDGATSPAAPDEAPANRIDYIFVSPGIRVVRVTVPVDARTRLAADHYPVIADLVLTPAAGGRAPAR